MLENKILVDKIFQFSMFTKSKQYIIFDFFSNKYYHGIFSNYWLNFIWTQNIKS